MTEFAHHLLAQRIAAELQRTRLRTSTEDHLQTSIGLALDRMRVTYDREHRLSAGDRPDFLVQDVVIEAKVRYGKRSIYRQLERYAEHGTVAAIVLVSGTAMGMPASIKGKPVYVVSIGAGFL